MSTTTNSQLLSQLISVLIHLNIKTIYLAANPPPPPPIRDNWDAGVDTLVASGRTSNIFIARNELKTALLMVLHIKHCFFFITK